MLSTSFLIIGRWCVTFAWWKILQRAKYNIEELFVKWIAFRAFAADRKAEGEDMGVDRVTTNDAPKLARASGQPTVF
jgi:hypothetical protein